MTSASASADAEPTSRPIDRPALPRKALATTRADDQSSFHAQQLELLMNTDKYGEKRCYIRDPDGSIIEVGQSRPELAYG